VSRLNGSDYSTTTGESSGHASEKPTNSWKKSGRLSFIWNHFWRGPDEIEPWERPALLSLLTAIAALYLWGLDANGWANPYYSAAAQAGAHDWKAFFFGSFEWGNLITVDKTPLSIWVMALSVRLFGLSSWSILVPQALMGVATSYLMYRLTRRGFGPRTAIFCAAVYATTPVVMLMSRFNNPEPLMGLLTVSAVFTTLRAMESGKLRTFAWAGFFLGLGFMAKQVQALLVLPALGICIIAFSQGQFRHRLQQGLAAAGPLIATSLAWLITVDSISAADRPYVGGSLNNSALELTMDYNGLARFLQIPLNSEGNKAADAGSDAVEFVGGLPRLLNGNFAQEIAWLLVTGIFCSIMLVVLHRRLDLDRRQRNIVAVSVVWFGTALTVLCSMGTMIHTYYTYSLGAPLALTLALGLSSLWKLRQRTVLRVLGAILISSSSYLATRVMEYSHEWPLWLRICVPVLGLIGAVLWVLPPTRGQLGLLTSAILACSFLAAPIATNLYTLSTPQWGTNPMSGPAGSDSGSLTKLMAALKAGEVRWAQQTALGVTVSEITEMLKTRTSDQQWGAATFTAQNAALYQLQSGRPVIPLGGWLGSDPAPTLERFRTLVAEKQIGYFILPHDLLDRGGLSMQTQEISEWVRQNFSEEVVNGVSVYDLRR
jgi:4-amino-4-deoxy-L-arabinose transferase-like glycosyltransferase